MLSERLQIAMKEAGVSQADLARACGVKPPSVNGWLSGKAKFLRGENLLAAARALNVSQHWLATGKGPMRSSGEQTNFVPTTVGSRQIPLINSVQAGMWTEIADSYQPGDAADWLLTDLELSEHAFALEIRGDSMLPDFRPGDRVIIDPVISPNPGDFVVAKNGSNEATFKKYRPRGVNEQGQQIFELVPLNPDYETMRSDFTPIAIIGTMVEHRRYRKK